MENLNKYYDQFTDLNRTNTYIVENPQKNYAKPFTLYEGYQHSKDCKKDQPSEDLKNLMIGLISICVVFLFCSIIHMISSSLAQNSINNKLVNILNIREQMLNHQMFQYLTNNRQPQ